MKLGMNGHDQDLQYEPGDHLAVFPANPAKMVEAVLTHVEATPGHDEVVNVQVLTEMPGSTLKCCLLAVV